MKKVFNLIDLDCAVCAAKMQEAIAKIEGVNAVEVNFIAQKLMLDYDETKEKEILKKVVKAIKKVEPDCRVAGI